MFVLASRRAVEALIVLFALLGFVFVPLGKKTGLEHARAIARTAAATDALRELALGGDRLRRKLIETFGDATRPEPSSNSKPAPPRR